MIGWLNLDNNKINIVHTCRSYYPVVGGVETYIKEIATRLNNYGFQNSVIALNWDISNSKRRFKTYEKSENISIERINGFGSNRKIFPSKIPTKKLKQAAVVHIHDLRFLFETVFIFKKIFKYKIVLSTHGFIFHTNYMAFFKKMLFVLYYRPIINNFVDSVICDGIQDWNFCKRMNIKNIHLIENGIDYKKYASIKREPKEGEYLYFGRIDKNKGIDKLLSILKELNDSQYHLNIVGNGKNDVVDSLKNMAKELEIDKRVTWHGFVDEQTLFSFLAKSHICFFPSSYEGFGFTFVEAMAAGCVCIGQNNTSYSTLADDGENAILLNFNDKKNTLNVIKKLSIGEKYFSISVAAKEKTKVYQWENRIERIVNVYKNIINSKAGPIRENGKQ